MKTIQTLKSEIDGVVEDMKIERKTDTKESKGRYKRLNKKFLHLKLCLLYIETEPSADFIKKEKERLTDRINAFMDKYIAPEGWSSHLRSKHKSEYEKEMDLPKLRQQVSTLNFLLK